MEVTEKNFKQVFPSVKQAIEDCDFISFDTEFTGLFDEDNRCRMDSDAERYTKCREHASSFIIVQFGLSTFKYHEKEDKYSHQDFNFYIFPNSSNIFVCQASSCQFLVRSGLDFNKVISEGIPYLTPVVEEKCNIEMRLENEQKAELSAKGTSNTIEKEKLKKLHSKQMKDKDLEDFKQMVRELFPKILDTKVMASSKELNPLLKTTNLMGLMQQLQKKKFKAPNIEPADNTSYELSTKKAHEAGFDAFATGFCFIVLTRKLGSIQSVPLKNVELSSEILSPFINRIYINRVEVPFIDLSSPDPYEPKRDNVFYVTFPSDWEVSHLTELFLPFGNIGIDFIDDSSALVTVKDRTQVVNATSLVNSINDVYSVQLFSEYQSRIGCASSKPDSVSKKRKASDSPSESMTESSEKEAEKADHSDETTKKKKHFHEDIEFEVSSTAPVFDEEKLL